MRQGGGGDHRQTGTQKGSKEKWKFLKYLLGGCLCVCGRERRRVSNGIALRVSLFFSLSFFSLSFSFFLIKPNSPTRVEFSDSKGARDPCHSPMFCGTLFLGEPQALAQPTPVCAHLWLSVGRDAFWGRASLLSSFIF